MIDAGTLWSPRDGLSSAVRRAEAAVTHVVLGRIHAWRAGEVSRCVGSGNWRIE